MNAGVNAHDRALAASTASVLESAAALRGLQLLALGLAAWLALATTAALPLLAATLLLGLWGYVLQLRLALDSRVLRDFADARLQPEAFDQHLALLGLVRPAAGRSMAQRCAGAMRLWRWLWLAVLCQLGWVVALAAWARYVS